MSSISLSTPGSSYAPLNGQPLAQANTPAADGTTAAKPSRQHHHHHRSGAESSSATTGVSGASGVASTDPLTQLIASTGNGTGSQSGGSTSGNSSGQSQQYSNPLLGANIDISA